MDECDHWYNMKIYNDLEGPARIITVEPLENPVELPQESPVEPVKTPEKEPVPA